MDPATYDDDAYRKQLLAHMKKIEMIVFDAVFAPTSVSSEPILVCATSIGRIVIFAMGEFMGPQYWEDTKTGLKPTQPGPFYSFQAHPSQIYSLQFAGDASSPHLISGGDQDFRVWKWHEIMTAMKQSTEAMDPQPTGIYHLTRQSVGMRGAMAGYSEINDMAVAAANQHVFLAGGDNNAHEWDLQSESCVRQFQGHRDYLHSLQYLNHTYELVTGGEDGQVGIWDARSARKVEFLQPQPSSASTSNQWVSSLAMDQSETWLACGGGHKTSTQSGFVSMWHLPSRVPVHHIETHSNVHDVEFYQTSSLLTVGNESILNTWNRSSGALRTIAHTSLPSASFCVVDPATEMIAVGGAAPCIDVLMMPGVVSFTVAVD